MLNSTEFIYPLHLRVQLISASALKPLPHLDDSLSHLGTILQGLMR